MKKYWESIERARACPRCEEKLDSGAANPIAFCGWLVFEPPKVSGLRAKQLSERFVAVCGGCQRVDLCRTYLIQAERYEVTDETI